MAKLSWTDKFGKMKLEVENPNEELSDYFYDQIRKAYEQGVRKFFVDVEHAVRSCETGKTIIVEASPLTVIISKEDDNTKIGMRNEPSADL